jgi:tRNA-(ms[2]io[6]A)-hydroxylase
MAAIDTQALSTLLDFLPCETPKAWLDIALQHQDILLLNHAYLEKCAARSAVTLMFRYPEKPDLLDKMSRLAREELVHFEQVIRLLKKRGKVFKPMKASRYVGLLNEAVSVKDPERLIDSLIVGAYIEARSCERFAKLAPHLDEELSKFYVSLLQSEARHFQHYLGLAQQYSKTPIDDKVAFFGEIERQAIESDDPLFRFHSGVPTADYSL